MNPGETSLIPVFEGWEEYDTSLVHAVSPLPPIQLDLRPADHLRSVGALAHHISLGHLTRFPRMDAPGSPGLVQQAGAWDQDSDGIPYPQEDSHSILVGLPAVGHVVTRALPAAVQAYDLAQP